MSAPRPFAIVTGASTGIGFELAKCCVDEGFDLVVAADEAEIEKAAASLQSDGAEVEVFRRTSRRLMASTSSMRRRRSSVEALLANAGRGLGHAFLDQRFDEVRHVIDTNMTGTLYLIHMVGRYAGRKRGRILITGSIAGFMPGTFQAAYNGSKAFLNSFSFALRNELKDTGVSVTCLMPGATDTEFFPRADMLDTKVGPGQEG